ncbi:MAG: hypothetical protein WD795_16385 [Woeseia sp.]
MTSHVIDIDPANVSLVWFIDDGALVEDTPIALDETATPDGLAHKLSVDPSADIDGIQITIVGTDADNNSITEVIVGATTDTVESAKYFKTIVSVTPDTTDAATIDVGFVDEVASQIYPLNWREPFPAGLFQLVLTGTASIDFQFFIPDPARFPDTSLVPSVVDADLDGEAASVVAFIEEAGYHGFRVIFNSYTDTAELQIYTAQP